MSAIIFQPHVGPGYSTASPRVLIVAESHYGEPHEDPAEATRHVMHMWSSGQWNARTITTTGRVITGMPNYQMDRKTAFNDVAFYNFIQTMMADRSQRPTTGEGQASIPAFREVLDMLRPTHVVVNGYLQWWHLMSAFGPSMASAIAGERVECCLLPTPQGDVPALCTEHMSRASADYWHPIVTAFLKMTATDLFSGLGVGGGQPPADGVEKPG